MQKIGLLNLVEGISSWAELESLITALPSEQERGEAFEEFCKAFFLLDPVFQFEKVYRQNEIPPSLRQKLGYPGIQDIGIDGLAVTTDGKLIAYQAKFRSDRNNIPTLRELSTFFTISDKADWRITITNANSLPPAINDRTTQSRILVDRFDQLDSNFFDRLRFYLKEQRIEPQKKKTPHQTQKEALKSALSYFKKHDRGQLILPCGTGKTLASMWIAEKIGGSHILVMVPSLALMSQTLREWAANTVLQPFRYLCLCSDTTVDLGNDSPIEHLYEMDIPVTTDVKVVSDFLSSKQPATSILFSTYQSSKVLSKAVLKTGTILDVGIFDEAHRTTGTKVGVWNLALDDKNVPIKKRIFMTATPRIYAPHIVKKAKEEDILICSMDDSDVYGKTFYEMTFGEAIERNHITDYKIVVICVTDSEVKEIIQHGGRVITDDEHEWDAKAFAKRVALVKGINAYGLKKVFTFHSRVKGAKAFTDTDTLYGIDQVFRMLETKHTEKDNNFPIPSQEYSSEVSLRGAVATKQSHNLLKNTEVVTNPLGVRNDKNESSDNIKFFHVNGTMPSGVRNSLMKEFKESDIGIMSNARCLTEGVDVPVVDTVAFIDPKKSIIDIVQATGRAMRKAEWKERGYIFISVVVEENTDPEEIIKSSDFNAVWQVLQAMVDQDQRLEDVVSQMRIMQGKGEEGTKAWKDAMAEYAEKIEFYNLPTKIDKTRFINTLYTKTLEVAGKSWDFWYGLTLRYKEEFGTPNASNRYKTPEGFKLGLWQSALRISFKKGKLIPDHVKRLEDLGFKWSLLDESFEKGFIGTVRYKKQFGTPNAPKRYVTPDGLRLGQWQQSLKQRNKKGKLSLERKRKFDYIGFVWDYNDKAFERGLSETLKYKEHFGTPNAPTLYETSNGYSLGRWQSNMRVLYSKRKLDFEKTYLLDAIGFSWDLTQAYFEQGITETENYKRQHGTPNAPRKYITPEGFKLGIWQTGVKQRYRKNSLPDDQKKILKATGLVMHSFDQAFISNYQELLKYREQFGTANVPRFYVTPDGIKLGFRLSRIRQKQRRNRLALEHRQLLEGLGLTWHFGDEAFEKLYQETVRYKERFGTPNAPQNYVTQKGYALGERQAGLRVNRARRTSEQIEMLNAIGFAWQLRENKVDKYLERGFREIVKYKEQFGTTKVKNGYCTLDGFKLYSWQGEIYRRYKNNKLSKDYISRLISIGYFKRIREQSFQKGYQETIKYMEQYGSADVTAKHITPEGYTLGQWQKNQRHHYKKGKLSSEKINKLEEIGFKWVLKK